MFFHKFKNVEFSRSNEWYCKDIYIEVEGDENNLLVYKTTAFDKWDLPDYRKLLRDFRISYNQKESTYLGKNLHIVFGNNSIGLDIFKERNGQVWLEIV